MSEEYERVFNQMVNLWTDYPDAKEIAFHPRLAETARRLSGCRHVRIYHDHAMIKPPGQTSKETNWASGRSLLADGPGRRVVRVDRGGRP